MHSLPLNPYPKSREQRADRHQRELRLRLVLASFTPHLLLRQLCPTLSFFPPQLPLLAAATARAYIMKTIIAPANTQVFSFRHSTFNQREKMTTNDEWPKFKRLPEPEYPMWSTENQCRKWWPNDDYPKFSWLPEPESDKMATDKMATQNNPPYVS
jgi:hypothetical protein